MTLWAWLAIGPERQPGAYAEAAADPVDGEVPGADERRLWLQAFPAGPRPTADAVRVDARVLDPAGAHARVSLVRLAEGRAPLFDDPAVSQALRDVLAGPPVDAVTTFTRDPVHLAGALTVVRDARDLRGDPFRRFGVQEVLAVGPGLLGAAALTIGPVTQRYGGAPWPVDAFPAAAPQP